MVINLHSHGQFFHLPEFVEKTVSQKKTPLDFATEFSESIFAKLNKMNNNKHIEDISVSWIETSWREKTTNKDLVRKRSGNKNDFISA